jgi:Tfp pilus assembly protein PilV
MVEFLLAAAILAVGLLGLAGLQAGAARAAAGARNRMAELNLAVSALEQGAALRRTGAEAGWTRQHDRDGQSDTAGAPFFTVTVTSGAGPDGTTRLRAAVVWREGRERTLRLERLLWR